MYTPTSSATDGPSRLILVYPTCIVNSSRQAGFHPGPYWNRQVEYIKERSRGYPYHEDLLCPGVLETTMTPGDTLTLAFSLSPQPDPEALWAREQEATPIGGRFVGIAIQMLRRKPPTRTRDHCGIPMVRRMGPRFVDRFAGSQRGARRRRGRHQRPPSNLRPSCRRSHSQHLTTGSRTRFHQFHRCHLVVWMVAVALPKLVLQFQPGTRPC